MRKHDRCNGGSAAVAGTPLPARAAAPAVTGVGLLTLCVVLVKVIGLGFKIPMSYRLGSAGMSTYNSAYTIYTWLYMISTAGFPVAVSVAVSGCFARGDLVGARRYRRLSLAILSLLGIVGWAIMFFCADPLACAIGSPDAAACIRSIAPTLFFICISSALRGWFQGCGRMAPSALSQLWEAIGKAAIGVALATRALRRGASPAEASAYAVWGVTIGVMLGCLHLLLTLRVDGLRRRPVPEADRSEGDRSTLARMAGRLLRLALPITVSASVMSLTNLLDLGVMMRRLLSIGYDTAAAEAMYGAYTTAAVPVFHLPSVLVYPLAGALVPLLSGKAARQKGEECRAPITAVCRVTACLTVPAALGLLVLAEPVLLLIFPEEMAYAAAPLLRILAPGVILTGLLAVTNSVLQAYLHPGIPVLSMLCGGGVKLLAAWLLAPVCGVLSTPLSTLLCYAVAVAINLAAVSRITRIPVTAFFGAGGAFAAGALCAAAAFAGYTLAARYMPLRPAVLAALALAVSVCLAAAVLLRGVTREDIEAIPGGGQKLSRLPFIKERKHQNDPRRKDRRSLRQTKLFGGGSV